MVQYIGYEVLFGIFLKAIKYNNVEFITKMNICGHITVDGGFGPGTKGALAKYNPSLDRVRCYRLKHYYDLVNKKPEQERFLFGWYRRALSV